REDCLEQVSSRAAGTPKGQWILGHGWAQAEWPGGFGTAAELDAAAPDNPVYLTAKSLHAAWANSAALAIAGVDAQTADPPGGVIQRLPDGRPSGILFELAMNLVAAEVPKPDVTASAAAIRDAQRQLWRLGLTGVHDFDRERCFSALQELLGAGELRLRVLKSIPVEDLDLAVSLGLKSGFGNDLLRIGSIKAFSDGALGPRTAAMLQPFDDDPDNTGILLLDREEVYEIGRKATAHGFSLAVHAIGDRANHEVISAFSQIRQYEGSSGLPARRHRIEHVQLIHPEDVRPLAASGVIASMQPIHATSDMVAADRSWGARSKNSYAWQTLRRQGIFLTFGSDAPVDSPNPFWGIHAAVTRARQDGSPGPEGWYPEQRLLLQDALHGFTVAPAFTAGMENRLGQIAEGRLADLVILPEDPFKVDPENLWKIEPLATIIGGEWVYSTL
ncbi:MAG TPA: amidohydrolase, partial [Anaerolineales bacterium]|nr:amidohydrolase [Anaerolineales bacterium]